MNYDFYRKLNKAKSWNNASAIEAIKKLYLMCELAKDNQLCSNEGACKFINMSSEQEISGERVDDRCYVFNCSNGTIRLTLIDDNTVLVEASPTGVNEMYRDVGKVGIDTGLKEAIAMGQEALNNDDMTTEWFNDMNASDQNDTAPEAEQ